MRKYRNNFDFYFLSIITIILSIEYFINHVFKFSKFFKQKPACNFVCYERIFCTYMYYKLLIMALPMT